MSTTIYTSSRARTIHIEITDGSVGFSFNLTPGETMTVAWNLIKSVIDAWLIHMMDKI